MIETPLKLGLIGDKITQSRSPDLHRAAARLAGVPVTYDLLIPKQLGASFEEVFASVQQRGLRGVNVTYPYKERVVDLIESVDPSVRAIGAVNTVLFESTGPQGFNTDYTGFIAAYRGAFGNGAPGKVCLIGAGGVGKAIAFALCELGADEICCVDLDLEKAEALAASLAAVAGSTTISVASDATDGANLADGLINCTPLGMTGIGGSPLGIDAMANARWAFDAVYTPVETKFLRDAATTGLSTLSGFELFFHQGITAWAHFSNNAEVDQSALRHVLAGEPS